MHNALLAYSILATLLILLGSAFIPIILKSTEDSDRRSQGEESGRRIRALEKGIGAVKESQAAAEDLAKD